MITRIAGGKTLEVPRTTVTLLSRHELLMGDERPHNQSEPTSYISQKQPVEVHIDDGGVISIINKQPFGLIRGGGGTFVTHHGHLPNVQPSDCVCFCPKGIPERAYATFSFRLTPDGSDTEEEDVVKTKGLTLKSKGLTLKSMEGQRGDSVTWDDGDEDVQVLGGSTPPPPFGWAPKKRNLPPTSVGSGGRSKCGICGNKGHNKRTCAGRE